MSERFGRTSCLKALDLKKLKKIETQRVRANEVAGLHLIGSLCGIAGSTGRMVGVFLDRKGHVERAFIGERDRLYLPDIGRYRASQSRLRGLRLIVAKPLRRNPGGSSGSKGLGHLSYDIDSDFIIDLEKLQLDAVLQIETFPNGSSNRAVLAYLSPLQSKNLESEKHHEIQNFKSTSDISLDFEDLVRQIEKQLEIRTKKKALIPGKRGSTVLVGVYTTPKSKWKPSLSELKELARTAEANVVDVVVQQRRQLDPKTIVGKGKLEEICLTALHKGAEVLIFDRDLTPSQLNAITDMTDLKVLDRTMLIMDIFAKRAKTRSGKLQVELAQLKYSLPRLAKKQSGLSRLTGGIGGQGPGETKLEVDRRRAKDKIAKLEREVVQLGKQRVLRRKQRNVRQVPTIAIVGYTNAGKSTLLNKLTNAEAYVQNELFATLDPTSRRLRFPEDREVVLIDTVGFIRDLPAGLKDAFRTTLEELCEADLLIHVVDATDPQKKQHIDVVEKVLSELGVSEVERVLAFNKCDLLSKEEFLPLKAAFQPVMVSAMTGLGLESLLNHCAYHLWQTQVLEKSDVWVKEPVSSSHLGN